LKVVSITLAEHQQIIAAEKNSERKALYQLRWHLGVSHERVVNGSGLDIVILFSGGGTP
jgi:hypothetical protein